MDRRELLAARIAHPGFDADPAELDQIPVRFVDENRIWALLAANGVDLDGRGSTDRQSVLFEELDSLLEAFHAADARVILIKYPPLPKRHRDLDLLVVDGFQAVDDVLHERGFVVTGDGEPYKRGYERTTNGTTIELDVHEAITWWGNVYIDSNRLWAEHRTRDRYGATVRIPSPEHELLICAANAAFGEVRLNLFDVFTAWSLVDNGVDVQAARETAARYRWGAQFDYIMTLMDRVHLSLFGSTLGLSAGEPAGADIDTLPYRYPLTRIVGLRAGKVRTDLARVGVRSAVRSARGYVLELAQLGIDYFFYHTNLPKHSVFNMRSYLGEAKR